MTKLAKTRLTKLQRTLIEHAMARADGALRPASESITATEAAVTRAVEGLVRRGLATQVAAPDEAGAEAGSLVLTEAGRAVVTDMNSVSAEEAAPSTPREAAAPGGKLGVVLKAIRRKGGATLVELTEATGWQPHTTRAALTRLRQRGFPAALTEEGGRRAYRLQG
jgi:DNA-binding MarR family transcriptional regulator